MKRIITAAAVAALLAAAPAQAGLIHEVAQEKDTAVQLVQAPRIERGAGNVVNSQDDGRIEPARLEGLRQVPYPASERPAFERGR